MGAGGGRVLSFPMVQEDVGPDGVCRCKKRAQAEEGPPVGRAGLQGALGWDSQTDGGEGHQAAKVREEPSSKSVQAPRVPEMGKD